MRYSASLISLSIFSVLFVYVLQRLQGHLPLNPMHFSTPQAPQNATPMTPDLAFNTAVSFLTNTNWQSYSPDTTVSYFTQMTAFAVQNFVSAAVGIAVAIAMIRGFARHTVKTIGNFWVDVTRATIYILLPVCVLATLFFVWQGSIQNFKPPVIAQTLEGTSQTIEQGPLASQEAIKMLGTNGGGFFNANSAHPYENPTPLSNMLQMFLIFVIGAYAQAPPEPKPFSREMLSRKRWIPGFSPGKLGVKDSTDLGRTDSRAPDTWRHRDFRRGLSNQGSTWLSRSGRIVRGGRFAKCGIRLCDAVESRHGKVFSRAASGLRRTAAGMHGVGRTCREELDRCYRGRKLGAQFLERGQGEELGGTGAPRGRQFCFGVGRGNERQICGA